MVIPGPPLEDNVPLGIQLLDDCTGDEGPGMTAGDDLAHVHLI